MILKYFLAFWFLLGTVVTIAGVGKQKDPTTPAVAAISTVINLCVIAAIFAWWPE